MARQEIQNSEHEAEKSIRKRKLHLWLVVAIIFLIAFGVIIAWMKRALPRIAIAEISNLTNTKIEAESIEFHFNGSVYIKNLIVKPDQDSLNSYTILRAGIVYARFNIYSLLLLKPRLKEVYISNFIFEAQFDLDSRQWNVATLTINVPEKGAGKMPLIRLEKGKLRYTKMSKGHREVAVSMPVEASFGLDEKTPYGYKFTITTATLSGGYGKSKLTGYWKPGCITIAGGISSQEIASSERKWAIDVLAAELKYDQDRDYSLTLRMKDMYSSYSPTDKEYRLMKPAFMESSGPLTALQELFGRYCPTGIADVELQASGNLDQMSINTISGKVYCKDVSICDRKFPYVLEHLTGRIDFTKDSIVLNNLSGKHDEVDVTVNGWSKEYGVDRQYQIRVTSQNMVLDKDLYDALSVRQKSLWDAFSPSGLVSIDYRFRRQSPTDKSKTLTVELLNVEGRYKNFTYPLKNLTGTLFFDQSSIVISEVVSRLDKGTITIDGRIAQRDTDNPVYYISIKANEIPLDATLISVLPDKQQDFCSRFEMAGVIDADIKVFTEKTISAKVNYIAEVVFKGASLKVGGSRLTVSNVSAKTVVTPDSISISNFNGRYGQAEVSLSGGVDLTGIAQQVSYHLAISGKDVQLNDDLIKLLPEKASVFVSAWQPKGKIDFSANLNKNTNEQPDYNIVLHCLGDSITHKRFAYPLKNVTGRLSISNKSLTFEDISAAPVNDLEGQNGESRIRASGKIDLVDGVFNTGSFTFSARNLPLDEQLKTTFCKNIGAFSWQEFLPIGRCDLDLPEIRITNKIDANKSIAFSGSVTFKECNFNISGAAAAELNGILTTKGLYETDVGFSSGQFGLVADNLKIKGKSITNLKADINYNPDSQNWTSENILADCYGGKLIGKLEIRPQTQGPLEYLLQVAFNRIDLKNFLLANMVKEDIEKSCTGGNMSAVLSIGVRVSDESLRRGRCRISIVDMEVGKVSPLAKLLYVLSLTEPKDFAFEQMFIDSYIKDDKLIVGKFDMSGETLAFYGSGSLDLPTEQVDLALIARGQRLAAGEPTVLQSLTEGLGGAVVRMHVTGNVYDPNVETKALPLIEDSLKILGTRH